MRSFFRGRVKKAALNGAASGSQRGFRGLRAVCLRDACAGEVVVTLYRAFDSRLTSGIVRVPHCRAAAATEQSGKYVINSKGNVGTAQAKLYFACPLGAARLLRTSAAPCARRFDSSLRSSFASNAASFS